MIASEASMDPDAGTRIVALLVCALLGIDERFAGGFEALVYRVWRRERKARPSKHYGWRCGHRFGNLCEKVWGLAVTVLLDRAGVKSRD